MMTQFKCWIFDTISGSPRETEILSVFPPNLKVPLNKMSKLHVLMIYLHVFLLHYFLILLQTRTLPGSHEITGIQHSLWKHSRCYHMFAIKCKGDISVLLWSKSYQPITILPVRFSKEQVVLKYYKL